MAIRTTSEIMDGQPSVHTLPDGPQSESASTEEAKPKVEKAEGEKPEPVKTEASVKPSTVKVADDDDPDEDNDPVDQSLEGLKRSLAASRGDKRKLKKQWRESERKVEETARRMAHLEGQLAALSAGRQQQAGPEAVKPAELPDFYGDPDAHLTAREKRIRDELRSQREEIRNDQFKRDATRSERRMRREAQDYEEAKAAVLRAHGPQSQFWNQLVDDPEPAELVYSEGKKILRGGVSEREAQLQAELDELKAKQVAQTQTVAPRSPAKPIPQSIATVRGTGNGVPKSWNGPRETKSIFDS